MDKVEVKPTWKLAWGLLWRTMFIILGIYAIIVIPILLLLGITTFIPR